MQQQIFAERQGQLLSPVIGAVRLLPQHQAPAPLCPAPRGAPQDSLHPLEQDDGGHRLDDVIVRIQFECLHLGLLVLQRGQHDGRRLLPVLLDIPQHLEAVRPGHADVQHRYVELLLPQKVYGRVSPLHPGHLVSGHGHIFRQDLPNRGLVLQKQDSVRRLLHLRLPPPGFRPGTVYSVYYFTAVI